MQTENKTNYSTPVAIVLAGVIIASAMYFSDGRKVQTPLPVETTSLIEQVDLNTSPVLGNPNAPVVMAVWFDYLCGACGYNEKEIISKLVDDYVKVGKVKIIFKDFAFLSPQSQTIAVAGRAVWEAYPDKFYDWHKFILLNQDKKVSVTDYSGIDRIIIEKMIAEKKVSYQKMVDADKVEGIKFGINATPSFILGDKLYVGVPQYDVVKQIIDDLLIN
jgi:protein-disulfide isomerase